MPKKTKIIIIIATVLSLAIGGLAGYGFYLSRKNKVANIPTQNDAKVTPTPTAVSKDENQATPKTGQPQQTSQAQYKSATFLANFYSDYKKKDVKVIFSYFTDPVTDGEKNQKSLFMDGKDTNGNPGGPQLFETSIASGITDSYEITKEETVGGKLKVTLKEKRLQYDSRSASNQTYDRAAYFELVGSGSSFKIDKYYTDSCGDKYCGFLL